VTEPGYFIAQSETEDLPRYRAESGKRVLQPGRSPGRWWPSTARAHFTP
jgi:hypothetical protein